MREKIALPITSIQDERDDAQMKIFDIGGVRMDWSMREKGRVSGKEWEA